MWFVSSCYLLTVIEARFVRLDRFWYLSQGNYSGLVEDLGKGLFFNPFNSLLFLEFDQHQISFLWSTVGPTAVWKIWLSSGRRRLRHRWSGSRFRFVLVIVADETSTFVFYPYFRMRTPIYWRKLLRWPPFFLSGGWCLMAGAFRSLLN